MTLVNLTLVARNPKEATRHLGEARNIYDHLKRGGFFQHDVQFAQIGAALDQIAAQGSTAPRR